MTGLPQIPVGGITLMELLGRARARATATGRPVLATYVEPLPGVDPLDAFERAGRSAERVYWAHPAEGVAVVGVGAAVTVSPSGQGRFDAVARVWRALLKDGLTGGPGAVVSDGASRAGSGEDFGRSPMLLGGFRFDPECPADPRWLGYPDAWLAVPRLCLAVSPAGRWLAASALVRPGEDVASRADALERERDRLIGAGGMSEAAAVWATIAEMFNRPAPELPSHEGGQAERAAAREEFERGVALGARAVQERRLEKVVIARATDWNAAGPVDAGRTLRHLVGRYPDCHVFAVARGRKVFLGASPERLVRVRGDAVHATCLAGSIGRGATPEDDAVAAETLLASAKDREEHAIVVRAITAALTPLCEGVAAPAEPAVLTLPDVHHLHTPVTARPKAGVGLLELAARLHPTPAVGGTPREEAMAFIREQEGWDRGWYAAPVGWMDATGDGELVVALRSALLEGGRATLFAGCGVVADSISADEYMESEMKLRAMRGALAGAVPGEGVAGAAGTDDEGRRVDPPRSHGVECP